jgi:hypothetical protein
MQEVLSGNGPLAKSCANVGKCVECNRGQVKTYQQQSKNLNEIDLMKLLFLDATPQKYQAGFCNAKRG